MTTLMSEAPEIREQDLVPQRPWSKRPTSFWLAALLGTAVPLSFAGVLYFTTEIAAPLLPNSRLSSTSASERWSSGLRGKGKAWDLGFRSHSLCHWIHDSERGHIGVHARNDYCSGF